MKTWTVRCVDHHATVECVYNVEAETREEAIAKMKAGEGVVLEEIVREFDDGDEELWEIEED